MVRGALAAVLSRENDLDVVAEVESSDEVLTAIGRRPHVVLLDPQLPGKVGIEDLCRKLTGRGVLVLIDHEAIAATSLALVKQAPRIGLISWSRRSATSPKGCRWSTSGWRSLRSRPVTIRSPTASARCCGR
jgi:chemotaxis response regulator CheB